jgi:hypothetical protein
MFNGGGGGGGGGGHPDLNPWPKCCPILLRTRPTHIGKKYPQHNAFLLSESVLVILEAVARPGSVQPK